MKDNGLSKCSTDGSAAPKKKRRLRQVPSSVEPSDICDSSTSGSHVSKSSSKTSSKFSSKGGSSANLSRKSHTSKTSQMSSKGPTASLIAKFVQSSTTASGTGGGSHSKALSVSGKSSAVSGSRTSHKSSRKSKSTRKTPVPSIGGSTASNSGSKQNLSFDQKKLLYITNVLKCEIDRLDKEEPMVDCSKSKDFSKYKMKEDKSYPEPHSCKSILSTSHSDFPKFLLLTKLYDCPDRKLSPESALYLKILRHIGRKHPSIVHTWDVCYKDNNVFVVQEYAPGGSTETYVRKSGPLPEKTCQHVSKQIFKAMDYMGDVGISHRAISPAHVLICNKSEFRVKITGFRSAIVYWQPKIEDITYVACLPLDCKPKEPDFQAPEVYGNADQEEFDPISADIWAFGACVYFYLTSKYPYDITVCISSNQT